MSDRVRDAIEASDLEALKALLREAPELADEDVAWVDGERTNVVPPLHYVCDVVFRNVAADDAALAMADALLAAGVDPGRAYAKSGDTFLIAAASLGAESVGLRLVERGADVRPRGLFGATALHWAAMMGLDRLAPALLDAGAEIDLVDERYGATPLEWAIHGWKEGTSGRRDGLPAVARVLVDRGADVPPGAASALESDAARPMRAAIGLR